MLKRTLIAILCLMTMAGSTACDFCSDPSHKDVCDAFDQHYYGQ